MKVIEGEFRVLSEDGEPVKPKKRRSRLRAVLTHPYFWMWVWMLTVVGLTEGLW